jgi:hypothetical protein
MKRASENNRRRLPIDSRWNKKRETLTIRAPQAIELGFRKLTLTNGDLSRVFLFAVGRVDLDSLACVNTMSKKHGDTAARPKLGRAFLVKVGRACRARLNRAAKEWKVPVNCVAVAVLTSFLKLIRRQPGLKRELTVKLRRRRGL